MSITCLLFRKVEGASFYLVMTKVNSFISADTMDPEILAMGMVKWHKQVTDTLLHMAEIPEGTEMELNGEKTYTLEGDLLTGYMLGLYLALIELENFPLIELEEDE